MSSTDRYIDVETWHFLLEKLDNPALTDLTRSLCSPPKGDLNPWDDSRIASISALAQALEHRAAAGRPMTFQGVHLPGILAKADLSMGGEKVLPILSRLSQFQMGLSLRGILEKIERSEKEGSKDRLDAAAQEYSAIKSVLIGSIISGDTNCLRSALDFIDKEPVSSNSKETLRSFVLKTAAEDKLLERAFHHRSGSVLHHVVEAIAKLSPDDRLDAYKKNDDGLRMIAIFPSMGSQSSHEYERRREFMRALVGAGAIDALGDRMREIKANTGGIRHIKDLSKACVEDLKATATEIGLILRGAIYACEPSVSRRVADLVLENDFVPELHGTSVFFSALNDIATTIDPDGVFNSGRDPVAFKQDFSGVLEDLLRLGVDLAERDNHDRTPLMAIIDSAESYCKSAKDPEVGMPYFRSMISSLMEKGAEIANNGHPLRHEEVYDQFLKRGNVLKVSTTNIYTSALDQCDRSSHDPIRHLSDFMRSYQSRQAVMNIIKKQPAPSSHQPFDPDFPAYADKPRQKGFRRPAR